MKNIFIVIAVLAILGGVMYWYSRSDDVAVTGEETQRVTTFTDSDDEEVEGKLKADMFSGTLEEVNTGCFADAECYVVVDGKHITVLMGWSRETVGAVVGVDGIGDLESHIGNEVEVYAQDNSDGTYTLYGSEGFYVKVK